MNLEPRNNSESPKPPEVTLESIGSASLDHLSIRNWAPLQKSEESETSTASQKSKESQKSTKFPEEIAIGISGFTRISQKTDDESEKKKESLDDATQKAIKKINEQNFEKRLVSSEDIKEIVVTQSNEDVIMNIDNEVRVYADFQHQHCCETYQSLDSNQDLRDETIKEAVEQMMKDFETVVRSGSQIEKLGVFDTKNVAAGKILKKMKALRPLLSHKKVIINGVTRQETLEMLAQINPEPLEEIELRDFGKEEICEDVGDKMLEMRHFKNAKTLILNHFSQLGVKCLKNLKHLKKFEVNTEKIESQDLLTIISNFRNAPNACSWTINVKQKFVIDEKLRWILNDVDSFPCRTTAIIPDPKKIFFLEVYPISVHLTTERPYRFKSIKMFPLSLTNWAHPIEEKIEKDQDDEEDSSEDKSEDMNEVAELIPEILRDSCKDPKSADFRLTYDAPTKQTIYTYSLTWEDDNEEAIENLTKTLKKCDPEERNMRIHRRIDPSEKLISQLIIHQSDFIVSTIIDGKKKVYGKNEIFSGSNDLLEETRKMMISLKSLLETGKMIEELKVRAFATNKASRVLWEGMKALGTDLSPKKVTIICETVRDGLSTLHSVNPRRLEKIFFDLCDSDNIMKGADARRLFNMDHFKKVKIFHMETRCFHPDWLVQLQHLEEFSIILGKIDTEKIAGSIQAFRDSSTAKLWIIKVCYRFKIDDNMKKGVGEIREMVDSEGKRAHIPGTQKEAQFFERGEDDGLPMIKLVSN